MIVSQMYEVFELGFVGVFVWLCVVQIIFCVYERCSIDEGYNKQIEHGKMVVGFYSGCEYVPDLYGEGFTFDRYSRELIIKEEDYWCLKPENQSRKEQIDAEMFAVSRLLKGMIQSIVIAIVLFKELHYT